MKKVLFLIAFLSTLAFGQSSDSIADFALTVRPYYNPSLFKAQESEIISNDYEFVGIKGIDLRFDYHFAKILTAGLGIGVHDFDLRIFNNGLWQWIKNEENIEDVDYFGQQAYYLTVPIEVGFAPRLFKGGWFEPRATIGITTHFRVKNELTVTFNDSTTWASSQQTKVMGGFEGGAREVYTSLDATADFKVWLGGIKRTALGVSFAYSHNLSGPQSFLLRNGIGFRLGLTISRRF